MKIHLTLCIICDFYIVKGNIKGVLNSLKFHAQNCKIQKFWTLIMYIFLSCTSAFFCWSSKARAISTGSTSQEKEDSWLRAGFPAFSPHTNLQRSDAICCTNVLMLWDLWWLWGNVERSCCHRRRRNISFTLCRDATLVSKEYKVGLFQQYHLKSLFFN